MNALKKCPSTVDGVPVRIVYRGLKFIEKVKMDDVINLYQIGQIVTWLQFTSCTWNIGVLNDEKYCGAHGNRILFILLLADIHRGRIIQTYSLVNIQQK